MFIINIDGDDKMKNYLKANMWDMIMEYLGSMLIAFVIGSLIDLNLFRLFIVDTIIIFLDYIRKYINYRKENKDNLI